LLDWPKVAWQAAVAQFDVRATVGSQGAHADPSLRRLFNVAMDQATSMRAWPQGWRPRVQVLCLCRPHRWLVWQIAIARPEMPATWKSSHALFRCFPRRVGLVERICSSAGPVHWLSN